MHLRCCLSSLLIPDSLHEHWHGIACTPDLCPFSKCAASHSGCGTGRCARSAAPPRICSLLVAPVLPVWGLTIALACCPSPLDGMLPLHCYPAPAQVSDKGAPCCTCWTECSSRAHMLIWMLAVTLPMATCMLLRHLLGQSQGSWCTVLITVALTTVGPDISLTWVLDRGFLMVAHGEQDAGIAVFWDLVSGRQCFGS